MVHKTQEKDWRPAAHPAMLRLRARVLARIRAFFAERGVLEVETPLLASTTMTEPHLASIEVAPRPAIQGKERLFLQTSPESFMKRLLAAGSGPIFQICKAFRAEEMGRYHNPEFTILEWYRPGFDSEALMDEINSLMNSILGTDPGVRMSYVDAFRHYANLDPFRIPLSALRGYARILGVSPGDAASLDRGTCLDLVLSRVVQPALGPGPVFIFGFPATQASMARLVAGEPGLAERFELFVDGIELANGYRELNDSWEQRSRFLADMKVREERRLPSVPIDERLLRALAHGLPDCTGVAVGIDRLVMLVAEAANLESVMGFPFERV
uniref:Lysyl-tRNA synthetase, class 2 n=1 Tax=Candidatus Kentrum sp. FM TaxID=2126340 RepID=A0A450U059_9GAMM|nr:MAG: lysyl-tRNA synthetase, class 2 [Candidatus Kentron sp. FM]VFJ75706.1 MAG: lysyl-tRNA synthetase, class 2 [Candidatus Kentron sp. FM]VFK21113.1 MAG: lysyl-tRNA synthetase, class 2 [Candidatus Kentron sp. FM]